MRQAPRPVRSAFPPESGHGLRAPEGCVPRRYRHNTQPARLNRPRGSVPNGCDPVSAGPARLQCWPYGCTGEKQARNGGRSLPGRGGSGDGGPSWNTAPDTAFRRQRAGAGEVPDARRDNAGRRRHRRTARRACAAHLGHPSRRMCTQRVPAASGGQESRTHQKLLRGSAPRRERPVSRERCLLGGAQVPRPPISTGQPSALHHHPAGRPPRACRIGLVRDVDPRDLRKPFPDRRHAVPPRPGVRRGAIRRKARLSPARPALQHRPLE